MRIQPFRIQPFLLVAFLAYTQTLTAVPIATYLLDGNALDSSGNGYHGTPVGAVPVADRLGAPNAAYYFDGNDRIDIPDSIFGPGIQAFTISAWIEAETPGYQSIVHKGSSNGEVAFEIANDIFSFGPNFGSSWPRVTAPLILNEPVHLVGVYEQGSRLELWVNGLLADSIVPPSDPNWHQSPGFFSAIGAYVHSAGTRIHFTGRIDEIRIYSHALSAAEISRASQSLPDLGSTSVLLLLGAGVLFVARGKTSPSEWNGLNLAPACRSRQLLVARISSLKDVPR